MDSKLKMKRLSKVWRYNDSPRLKNYRQGHDLLHVMFIVAYDFYGVLVAHSVRADNPVYGACYSYFFEHNLRPVVRRKRPNLLNSHHIVLHDGTRSHIATAPVVNLLRR